jgi:hypothetical protein
MRDFETFSAHVISTNASVSRPRTAGSTTVVNPAISPRASIASTRRLTAGAERPTAAPTSAKVARALAVSCPMIA